MVSQTLIFVVLLSKANDLETLQLPYIPPRISKVVISFVVFQGCHWPNPHGRACPVRRPGDGLALTVATRLGVKFGTVVEMRVRSNAPVCFDDVGDQSSLQTGHSPPGGRVDESTTKIWS